MTTFDRQFSPRMTGICVFTDRNHVPPAESGFTVNFFSASTATMAVDHVIENSRICFICGFKEEIKKRSVLQKIVAKVFRNGEDTVTVRKFKKLF